ncbi:hypothetical protein FQA39_LY02027 [Lamprigera yunnana]|nr:hypothetical protein FQA39_LY02027 [Lamprigera yunnana]
MAGRPVGGKFKLMQFKLLKDDKKCVALCLICKKKLANSVEARPRSHWKILPNTEAKIITTVGQESKSLEAYKEGEIFVRGPQAMEGYNNKPKETPEVLVDGWLRTGDLGYYVESENFFMKDRLKELIEVKGFQVPPAEPARYNSKIVKSHYPNVIIPNIPLAEFILKDFSKHSDKIALESVETGKKYTFEEVRRKSINLNRGLRKKVKLERNDVVAIILPNLPEYAICLLGSLLGNFRITTVNPLATADEIVAQLVDSNVDSNAKAIFCTCLLENHIKTVISKLRRTIPVIALKVQVTDTTPLGFISFDELVDTQFDIDDDKYLPKSTDTTIIPYSSGTSGLPKGVLHSHRSIISFACQMNSPTTNHLEPTTENFQESVPVIFPFFHVAGMFVHLINQLTFNSKLVTITKFTPDVFVRMLEEHKPKFLYAAPSLVLFLINSPLVTQKCLETVKHLFCGSAPLGASDEEKLYIKSGGNTKTFQAYGLTEASIVFMNVGNTNVTEPAGSVGKLMPNTEVKIISIDDQKGESLEAYKEGEIFVRGPQVMEGYNNKPKETSEVLIDGWFRTGDLGYYDKSESFFVKDRLKELIKVKGFQVPPAELEELLRSYPNIADAVVIGVPHDRYGEVPRAYITLKPNSKINLKNLEKFVDKNVSQHKRIVGGFKVLDTLPKTASGKYLRKNLKLQYFKEKELDLLE